MALQDRLLESKPVFTDTEHRVHSFKQPFNLNSTLIVSEKSIHQSINQSIKHRCTNLRRSTVVGVAEAVDFAADVTLLESTLLHEWANETTERFNNKM